MEINQTQEELLNQLLRLTSPKELITMIQTTLQVYLLYQADNGLDMDFKSIINNHFTLLEFLQDLDKVTQSDETSI